MPYKDKETRNRHYREKYAKTKRQWGISNAPYRYRDSEKNSQLMRTYGITLQDYNAMFEEQDGRCAICGVHQSELKRALAVDHDHGTGEVRGLLCQKCNAGIGNLRDDASLLKRAACYLGDC